MPGNSGMFSGLKRLWLPRFLGGGDPANDGKVLVADSTVDGGATLAGARSPSVVTPILSSGVAGESFPRYQLLANGTQYFGVGTSAPNGDGALTYQQFAIWNLAYAGTPFGQFGRFSSDGGLYVTTAVGDLRLQAGGSAGNVQIFTNASGKTVLLTTAIASNVVCTIRGAASQSGDLLRLQNGTPTNVARVDVTGKPAFSEATNGPQGVATLVAGTVTVNNTNVTANSRIFVQRQTDGGTVAASYSITRTAGTSFTLTAKDGTGANQTGDTSTLAYLITEPS